MCQCVCVCVWRNVSVPGEFFRWKVKRWESLSWRQHKVAPNRADRLTSTHPQNHKELGLYLLTAAAGGRVCAFGHMYKDLYSVLSKRSNGQIKTLLHNASWEKHTPAPTLDWSLPLPVPFCKRAIICLQSCAFQTELFRMNPLSLPVCRIPELSSSVWLRVRETWETEAGIVQASVCTTMTSRKRPNGYFKLFWYLFRTSQAVCGRKVWNRERLCSGNVKKRSQNVKKVKVPSFITEVCEQRVFCDISPVWWVGCRWDSLTLFPRKRAERGQVLIGMEKVSS